MQPPFLLEKGTHPPQSQFTASPSHPAYCEQSPVHFLINPLQSHQSVSNIEGFELQETVFPVLFSPSHLYTSIIHQYYVNIATYTLL